MRGTIVRMETTWLIPVIAVAVGAGVIALVAAIGVALRSSRGSSAPSDVVPGRPPFAAGPPGPELLQRLGIARLVRRATGVVQWQVEGREALAARTDGRGWATTRGAWSTRATTSGLAHSLVAVRLPGPLPAINVLSEGVIGSHVDVESSGFNRARDIRTDDDRHAHAVLTPRVIALLQDLPEDLSVQVVGDHLISFRRGVPTAAEVLQRAALLAQIAAAIPAFVYDGLGD